MEDTNSIWYPFFMFLGAFSINYSYLCAEIKKDIEMDNKQNKYISVNYQLYAIDSDGKKELVEETQQGNPFKFITGFGFSLDSFEQRIVNMQKATGFRLYPDTSTGLW